MYLSNVFEYWHKDAVSAVASLLNIEQIQQAIDGIARLQQGDYHPASPSRGYQYSLDQDDMSDRQSNSTKRIGFSISVLKIDHATIDGNRSKAAATSAYMKVRERKLPKCCHTNARSKICPWRSMRIRIYSLSFHFPMAMRTVREYRMRCTQKDRKHAAAVGMTWARWSKIPSSGFQYDLEPMNEIDPFPYATLTMDRDREKEIDLVRLSVMFNDTMRIERRAGRLLIRVRG